MLFTISPVRGIITLIIRKRTKEGYKELNKQKEKAAEGVGSVSRLLGKHRWGQGRLNNPL